VSAVELQGERPFLVSPGDHFVLRAENSSETFGGGVVVERLRERLPRRREGIVKSILERGLAATDPQTLVASTLRSAGEKGEDVADVALATGLRADAVPPAIEALVAAKRAVKPGRGARAFDVEGFQRLRKRVLDALHALHKKDPALPSVSLSALRAEVGRADGIALDLVVEEMARTGDLKRTPEGGVSSKSHSAEMSPAERERCDRVLELLRAGAGQPPEEVDLHIALGVSPALLKKTLLLLEARREVLRAGPFWFHAAWLEEVKAKLAAYARAKGSFTASEAREVVGSSRKYVIPLLEALDDKGFTRRAGDKRFLK
jgi:selenocysteine-specific elongation factor